MSMDAIGLRWLTQTWLLNTDSATAPFAGVDYFPGRGRSFRTADGQERVEEELLLNLRGTPAEIREALGILQRLLNEAGHPPGSPPPGALLLYIQRSGETAPWESRIFGGRLELAGENFPRERQRHSQGVRLSLVRTDAWEYADPYAVPLSNTNASRTTSGLLVHNHFDATPGHENYAEVAAADAPGDLPARLRIEMKHIHKSGAALGSVYLHQLVENLSASLPNVLEGETAAPGSGVTRTLLSAAAYSGGQAARLEWSGSPAETELARWSLSGSFLAWAVNKPLRPMLRFAAVPADSDLWLGWQAVSGGQVVWNSPPLLIPPGQALVDLPALCLPPPPLVGPLGQAAPGGLDLLLTARKSVPAACSLEVDAIQLLPLNGWRRLLAARSLAYGQWLVDDGLEGAVYGLQPLYERIPGYTALGEPLLLHPGRLQRFYFLNFHGSQSLVDLNLTVQLTARVRRRWL
jgi:hypothetical protein